MENFESIPGILQILKSLSHCYETEYLTKFQPLNDILLSWQIDLISLTRSQRLLIQNYLLDQGNLWTSFQDFRAGILIKLIHDTFRLLHLVIPNPSPSPFPFSSPTSSPLVNLTLTFESCQSSSYPTLIYTWLSRLKPIETPFSSSKKSTKELKEALLKSEILMNSFTALATLPLDASGKAKKATYFGLWAFWYLIQSFPHTTLFANQGKQRPCSWKLNIFCSL